MTTKKFYTGYDSPFYIFDEAPLNKEALLNHAKDLALTHKLKKCRKKTSQMIPSLTQDKQLLETAYKKAHESVHEGWEIDPVSEWFIDNYYLLEEQIKQLDIRDKSKSVTIPCVQGGVYDSYARVFVLAAEIVLHMEARLSEDVIVEFLHAYQTVSPLSMQELWLFPEMLMVALIKAAAGVAARSLSAFEMKMEAKNTAGLLEKRSKNTFREYIARVFSPENRELVKNSTYVKALYGALRDEPKNADALIFLDKRLAREDMTAEKMIRIENGKQARNQSVIANAITSVRMMSHIYWEELFEKLSAVDEILRNDEIYVKMDFESREYYRKMIEKIAKVLKLSEAAVAKEAIRLKNSAEEPNRHVGYFIAGEGRAALFREFSEKPPIRESAAQNFKKHCLWCYSVSNLSIAFVVNTLTFYFVWNATRSYWLASIATFFTYLPIYSIVHSIVNKIYMRAVKPAFIPKMDLKDGIPEDCKTVTVVPTLISDEKSATDQLEGLEVCYIANQDDNLYFALLGDFKDASYEITDEERRIVERVEEKVDELNKKYGREIFFYLHRKRQYIGDEDKYMGDERKRGALIDFCAALKGEKSEGFLNKEVRVPPNIRYVITLDADTQMPRDAAKKMIGAMSHPLNSPVVNAEGTAVIKGYGIMQPRIGIDVVSAAKTHFALIFSGQAGLDTYSTACSDLYQDLFGEGIFTGKGIFDLGVYYALLSKSFPKRRILSHDLLEGSYLRTGLLTDVILVDSYPSRYEAWAKRQHRWIRGDWQLISWTGKRVLNEKNEKVPNPINNVSKYKISDNLSRSLIMPACFAVIFLGLTVFWQAELACLVIGLLTLFYEPLAILIGKIIVFIKNTDKGVVLKDAWFETRNIFRQSFYRLSFLAYETYLNLDAVIRTLYRVYISKKNMLEWVTAAENEKQQGKAQKDVWRRMIVSPVIGIALILLSSLFMHRVSLVAIVIGALWFFAPSFAYMTGNPIAKKEYTPDEETNYRLRLLARKTWRFFDELCTEKTFMWAPDNFQEYPYKKPVDRTSSTNVAYSIIANIIARDFGYITLAQMMDRLEICVAAIEKCDKWHGHLYNWYDINKLETLKPEYVSSVDSGNLACYLLAAAEGIEDALLKPYFGNCLRGLYDTQRMEAKKYSLGIGDIEDTSNLKIFEVLCKYQREVQSERYRGTALKKSVEACLEEAERLTPHLRLVAGMPPEFEAYGEITRRLCEALDTCAPVQFIDQYHAILNLLSALYKKTAHTGREELLDWIKQMELKLGTAYINTRKMVKQGLKLAARMRALFDAMDFAPLYDEKKSLFSIGYNVKEGALSNSYYDLLASEARQTGFIAIAKGDIDQKHWFRLSRPLAVMNERRVLLSWGGTMFEYFMPLLLMKNYEYTLLDETYQAVVEAQKIYGEKRHIPWGISESGYYAFDLSMFYQYKAFGVQKLGLKSGLSKDTVISPYSTCLALMINPALAVKNLDELKKAGANGKYGLYEAIDYSRERMAGKEKKHIVKSYMAHHQGMILSALSNYLSDNYLQRLFHNAPIVKATELLLKEKIPARNIVIKEYEHQAQEAENPSFKEIRALRKFSLHTALYPETHMLSNGRYTCCVTQYGSGYSICGGILLNRWNNDFMREYSGIYTVLRDDESDMIWSPGFLPSGIEPEEYTVSFDAHKAEFVRKDRDYRTTEEIFVSPEANLEIRRITVANEGNEDRHIRIACAIEPVLCEKREFDAHPAFAEVFLQTRDLKEQKALGVRRRRKKTDDADYSMVLKAVVADEESLEYETNRERFFGRQITSGIPASIGNPKHKVESGMDTVLAIEAGIRIPKHEKRTISFVISEGENEPDAISQALNIGDDAQVMRVMDLAWTHSQVEMRYLGLKHAQSNVYQMIASRMILHTPLKEKYREQAERNRQPRSGLWQYGISGDLPICLFIIDNFDDLKRAKDIILAHEFWRLKGFRADLVMVNKNPSEYLNPIKDKLTELAQTSHARDSLNTPGGLYLLSADIIGPETMDLLICAASVVLEASEPFMKQILFDEPVYPQRIFAYRKKQHPAKKKKKIQHILENGLGNFASGGTEYTVYLKEGTSMPAPWSNILTNGHFGTLITMEGGGYTWAENCRMMRLTPFRNDGMKDIPGEGILIRDDDTGEAFSLMPGLLKSGEYTVTFGRGFGIFERKDDLATRVTVCTDLDRNVKLSLCEIANTEDRARNISLYYFMEPVLGEFKENAEKSLVYAYRPEGALTATNPFGGADGMAYIYMPGGDKHYTSYKEEFFGLYGSAYTPAAMKADTLTDRLGTGTPCLAMQLKLALGAGETARLPILFGFAHTEAEMAEALEACGTFEKAKARCDATVHRWAESLNGIKVRTPSIKFDTLINHWLQYQVYASRLYGRTGYFQSGGAYGFRDQLQDTLALILTDPDYVRSHILRSASKQFIEGDVLHWWHEPARGVRTHIRDDLLFLPYAACVYAKMTGDYGIFLESAPYLKSVPVPDGKDDLYMEFETGEASEPLYNHCVRAIERSLDFGERGLSKIGSGDWCDGMNFIGTNGKGESVWLSMFLYDVLHKFAEICEIREDADKKAKFLSVADEIAKNIEKNAWDGKWYKRAFFDDGIPVGSAECRECAIDLLPQAWTAIANCGSRQRQLEAYNSAVAKLVKREDGVICLFWPPFDHTEHNPGYVKGYRPGIRENGGQYTHSAAWLILAAAALKRKNDAYSLFELINPINNTATAAGLGKYKGEPFVMAGDVSYSEGLKGRAGWTWYTGSASWMYQAGIHGILGLQKEGEKLSLEPCIPENWKGYKIQYRYGRTEYAIQVVNGSGDYKGRAKLTLDGYYIGEYLYLADDGAAHEVKAELLP